MTKSQFTTAATPVEVAIAGQKLFATPKTFATGSVGYFLNGKTTVSLPDGTQIQIQVSANLIAVGSKTWAP